MKIRKKLALCIACTLSFATAKVVLGDAVMTGFSGIVLPDGSEVFPHTIKTPKKSFSNRVVDETFIDINGASVVVQSTQAPNTQPWDRSVLENLIKLEVKAKDIGQVFGITLDDAKNPNIYVTATSFYGLNIVTDDMPNRLKVGNSMYTTGDIDTRAERQIRGSRFARWMDGQFGEGGTAGTVWKIDGTSGKISKFADITLNNLPNSGPCLGNITYDRAHKQFFVSDLDTGMIHRLSKSGKDLGHFDHGVTARKLHGLKEIPLNPLDRADIQSRNFDTTNTDTWGYAREGRRVYGVTVSQNRLFYAVYNGLNRAGEIWSIGLDKKGNFSKDVRFELLVKGAKKNFPITDIIVRESGEMVLAQRVLNQGSYAFTSFAGSGKAQVLKYILKTPQDGKRDRWYPQPQEFFVGFKKPYRESFGGVALGYLYNTDGTLNTKICHSSIWISGEHLRESREFGSELGADGNGAQGYPFKLSDANKPALVSYSIYYPSLIRDIAGSIGDVEIAANPCICKYNTLSINDSSVNNQGVPAIGEADEFIDEVFTDGVLSQGASSSDGLDNSSQDEWPYDNDSWGGNGTPSIPLACIINPKLCEIPQNPGGGEIKSCLKVKTTPQAPYLQADGSWDLPLYGIESNNGLNIDSIKVTPVAGVGSITNGPILDAQGAELHLKGTTSGSFTIVDLCGFNSDEAQSGKPYECCNVRIKFAVGQNGTQTLEVLK